MEHTTDGTDARSSRARSTCAAPPSCARPSTPCSTSTGDVVVDISRVESIDMTTLKMLAVANRAAEREGRRVVLRGASPGVRRLLHLSHLRSMIPVEPGWQSSIV